MKSRKLLVIVLVLGFVFSFNLVLAEKIKVNTDIMVSEKINHYDGKQVGVYSFVKVGYMVDPGELIKIEKKVICYYKKEKSLGLPPKNIYSQKGIEIMEKGQGEYIKKEKSTNFYFKHFFLLMKQTNSWQKKYVYKNESWQDSVMINKKLKTSIVNVFFLCQILFFASLLFDRFFCYFNKKSVKYINGSCFCCLSVFLVSCWLFNFLFKKLFVLGPSFVNIFMFLFLLVFLMLFVLFSIKIYLQFLINCKASDSLDLAKIVRIFSVFSLIALGMFSYGKFLNPALFIVFAYLLTSFLVLLGMRFMVFYHSIANN